VGNRTRAKVVKNKVAPPFKEAEFDIIFGQGISKVGEILDIGVNMGIISKSGSWFSYGDRRLGQGRDNIKELFMNEPEFAKEVEEKVFAKLSEATQKTVNKFAAAKKAEASEDVEITEEKPAPRRRSANIDIDVE